MQILRSIVLVFMLSALFACKKDVPQPTPPAPGIPEHFSDLSVGSNFSWSTLQEIELQFDGYQAPVNVERKLTAKIPNTSNVILTAYLPISQVTSFQLQIPAEATELEIQYGAIVKRVSVSPIVLFSPKPEFE